MGVARPASHLLREVADRLGRLHRQEKQHAPAKSVRAGLDGYTGKKSSMRRNEAYARAAGVAPMCSRLHGLLCIHAWGVPVRYSDVEFVPIVRCIGYMFTR